MNCVLAQGRITLGALFFEIYESEHVVQSLNSYSYANDNPINRSDPTGRAATLAGVLQALKGALLSLQSYLNGGGGGVSTRSMPSPVMTNNVSMPMRATTWDPVSNSRIKTLDPRLQGPATDFVNDTQDWTGVKLRVNEAYRSVADQNAYYQKGRDAQGNIVDQSKVVTYAKGGQSYHNYGLALDVVIMSNGQPNWNTPITSDIAAYGQKQGFEWGGTWPTPKTDSPHFQMTFGQTYQSLSNSSAP